MLLFLGEFRSMVLLIPGSAGIILLIQMRLTQKAMRIHINHKTSIVLDDWRKITPSISLVCFGWCISQDCKVSIRN